MAYRRFGVKEPPFFQKKKNSGNVLPYRRTGRRGAHLSGTKSLAQVKQFSEAPAYLVSTMTPVFFSNTVPSSIVVASCSPPNACWFARYVPYIYGEIEGVECVILAPSEGAGRQAGRSTKLPRRTQNISRAIDRQFPENDTSVRLIQIRDHIYNLEEDAHAYNLCGRLCIP